MKGMVSLSKKNIDKVIRYFDAMASYNKMSGNNLTAKAIRKHIKLLKYVELKSIPFPRKDNQNENG